MLHSTVVGLTWYREYRAPLLGVPLVGVVLVVVLLALTGSGQTPLRPGQVVAVAVAGALLLVGSVAVYVHRHPNGHWPYVYRVHGVLAAQSIVVPFLVCALALLLKARRDRAAGATPDDERRDS